jgi:hypothetical protein
MRTTRLRTLPGFVLAAAIPLAPAAWASGDVVLHWNRVATDASEALSLDPLTESRNFAIVQLAVHDAVNAVTPRYETYRAAPPRASGASAEAAAVGAAHEALVAVLPQARTKFDEALAAALRSLGDGAAIRRGIDVGRAAARSVLAARADDGAGRSVVYEPGTRPGEYRPTPPDFTPAAMAQWGGIRPFALESAAQFRPGPPPAVDGTRARQDLEIVRALGAKTGGTRNAEQDEIARYWYENSTQGWNRIARTVAAERKLDLHDTARALALVNVAMADGFIAGFEAKYHYAYWRPATAILEAGHAGWEANLITPPVPDYPSTHTVLGAAAATALAGAIGTDYVPFEMTSGLPYPGITRSFWSLSEAAQENGASRVFAGIHFPTAVAEGYVQGQAVGAWALEHVLRPRVVPGADHASN